MERVFIAKTESGRHIPLITAHSDWIDEAFIVDAIRQAFGHCSDEKVRKIVAQNDIVEVTLIDYSDYSSEVAE